MSIPVSGGNPPVPATTESKRDRAVASAGLAGEVAKNYKELAASAVVDTVQDGFDTLNAKAVSRAPAPGSSSLLSKVGDSVGSAAIVYQAYRLPETAGQIAEGGKALLDGSMDPHLRMQKISAGADATSMVLSTGVTTKLLVEKGGPAVELTRKTFDAAKTLVGAGAKTGSEVVVQQVAREGVEAVAGKGTAVALAGAVGKPVLKKAVPILSAGFAAADVVSAVAVANDPKATTTQKVTSGVAAFGSTLSAAGTIMMVSGAAASATGVGIVPGIPAATLGAALALTGTAINVGANVYAWWRSS